MENSKITSMSDTVGYNGACNIAVERDDAFNNFKRIPQYVEILEHSTQQWGQSYLNIILRDNPKLLDNIEEFKKNDLYGNPVTYYYDKIGFISPSTLRYIKVLSDLINLFGDLSNKNIIEIGGGYGGQCFMISKVFNFKSYTIVDLLSATKLTRKYLDKLEVENVNCITQDELKINDHDLFISNYAFTECDKEIQKDYYDKCLKNSKSGYMISNFISDQVNVNYTNPLKSYSKNELINMINNCNILNEEPLTHRDNCLIAWGNNTLKIKNNTNSGWDSIKW